MGKLIRRLSCLLFLVSVTPQAHAEPATDADRIRQRLLDWREAFNARDAERACGLFAPDLVYSVPEIARGDFDRMCGNLRKLFAKPGLKFSYAEPQIHEIIVSGALAIVRLTWTLTSDAGGKIETSTEEGMDMFTRQPDGVWSITRFIALSSASGQ